jgi:succinoglycan biosynthesis protein ExoL
MAKRSRVVAYFGPDRDDPAVSRRVLQWRRAGFEVIPFAFTRATNAKAGNVDCVNLGPTLHHTRARRVFAMLRACFRLAARRRTLTSVNLFVARNLDSLALAIFARWLAGSRSPIAYEILDVNTSCTANGPGGALYRLIERLLLRESALLIVSSTHFIDDYYRPRLGYQGPWMLFENKVPLFAEIEPVTATIRAPGPERKWRIGWFGYLDDERSWKTLRDVAIALPDRVEIVVRGTPYTHFNMRAFLSNVSLLPNVSYGGSFRNPVDLPEMYGEIDLVWSIDTNDLSANSKWLLTNSIYEAGFFGKPALGLVSTAVGEMIQRTGCGWTLEEPLERSLIDFIERLTLEEYSRCIARHAATEPSTFREGHEVLMIWRLTETDDNTSEYGFQHHGRPVSTA